MMASTQTLNFLFTCLYRRLCGTSHGACLRLAPDENRIDVELGARPFRHLVQLPLAYFQARRVGDSAARVRELENIRSFLTGNALAVLLDVVFSVVFVAVMLFYSVPLTLIVLANMPLYFGLSLAVVPILRRRLDEKFARGAENQAMLVETVSAIQTVKATALDPAFGRRWDNQLAAYIFASFRTQNLASWAHEGVNLIGKLVNAAIRATASTSCCRGRSRVSLPRRCRRAHSRLTSSRPERIASGKIASMRVKQIEDLPMATSAELYQLSWVIEQLMADPRRIVQARSQLHMGQLVKYWDWGTGKLREARIAPIKDRQVTLIDEQSKQRFSVLYAAVVPVDDQQAATSSSPATAAPLRPPPEIHHKQDFRVGQRVSFIDQSLRRHVGEIVRINQRTATVHCDGRAWRVAFALLQHVTNITP